MRVTVTYHSGKIETFEHVTTIKEAGIEGQGEYWMYPTPIYAIAKSMVQSMKVEA